MTDCLFQSEPYRKSCPATVTDVQEGCVILDQTVFYPAGGGQPGDQGTLHTAAGQRLAVTDTRYAHGGAIAHLVGDASRYLRIGDQIEAHLDWPLRYAHMRMHTCLHLLGAVIPFAVTGGNISATRSRLDFDMQEAVDKETVTTRLNSLIDADYPVLTRWISQDDLASNPELIRTLSVRPPADAKRIRLLDIPGIDLQPCGGTHVAQCAEIGPVAIAKVEKKGRHNRRVHVIFA